MQTSHAYWSFVLILGLLSGPQVLKDFSPRKQSPFVYIPSGQFQVSETEETKLSGFYMSDTEVTNGQYNLYLQDLKRQNKTAELAIAQVQNEQWKEIEGYNQPLVEQYFTHPAYKNYPVVNISHQAAMNYCLWLTNRFNGKLDENKVEVRLPTKAEWTYAAQGGRNLVPYPWGGYYVQNSKGCYLANFNPQDANHDDGGMYTVLADAYFPNDYGLYNTSGNVAEMLTEPGKAMGGSWYSKSQNEIRVDSESTYEEAAPTLGFRPVMSVQTAPTNNKGFNPNKTWRKLIKEIQID